MALLIAVLCAVNSAAYKWTDPETGLIYCVGENHSNWSIYYADSAWVCGIDPELAVSHPTLRSKIIFKKPYGKPYEYYYHKELVVDDYIEIPVMPAIAKEQSSGDVGYYNKFELNGYCRFENSNLTEFVIPEGITKMIVDIEMENLKSLKFPKHLDYCNVYINCDKLEQLEIGDVSESASFYNQNISCRLSVSSKTLSSFVVPKRFKKLGIYSSVCNLDCPSLNTITLPQLEYLDYRVIESVENVYFHDDVTKIKYGQFSGCVHLKNVTFPNSLKEIEFEAFSGCKNIKTLQFPSSLKKIGESAFKRCKSLTDITIPYGIDTIYRETFEYCENVQTIKIPKSIKHIGDYAFEVIASNNTKLTDIYVHWEKPIEEDPCIFSSYNSGDLNSPIYANTTLNIVDDNLWDVAAPSRYLYRRTSPWKYFKHKKYSGGGGTIWSFRNTIGAVGNGTVCYDHYVMKEENGSTTETAITNEICNDTVEVTSQTCWIPMEEELTFKMEEGDSIVSVLVNGQEMKDKVFFKQQLWEDGKTVYKYTLTITGITNAYTVYVKFSGYESGTEPQTDDVTLKAKSYTREYGEANPTFGYEVTEGSVTSGTPTITCAATQTSPVGTYDIVINEGSVSNGTVNLVNGKLIITKAPLTIKAGTYTKKQGEENPEFEITYEGFKNGETSTVLTSQPKVSTTATKNSPIGDYDVVIKGAEAQNYEISYVNGKLTITQPDGIDYIQNDFSSAGIYNLSGQRLSKPQRGVNIINDKKIVVK